MRRNRLFSLLVCLLSLSATGAWAASPLTLQAEDVPNDAGGALRLSWEIEGLGLPHSGFRVLARPEGTQRAPVEISALEADARELVVQATMAPEGYEGELVTAPTTFLLEVLGAEQAVLARAEVSGVGVENLFNSDRLIVLLFVVIFSAMIWVFLTLAKRDGEGMFIRRIPGIDAIEEAVGRATEMGQPVLYVPGIEEMYDIQTIASMLILGKVSETVAEYSSEIIVSNRVPFVATVAEEVVRQGFYNAGRPEAHKPKNIRFISDEQFAFTAGTNGIMLREKPATNLFLGRFFAESLILAETGFQAKAIQVAGTAEVTQLPFFITACDYTLIGEELFAASAYLSREPKILSTLKAADWFKVLLIAAIVAGTLATTFGYPELAQLFEVK